MSVQRTAIVAGIYIVMSLITFAAFWLDKRAASRGTWRTPEKTLHILELVCGWPGAILAMKLLRHKNRKPAFWVLTVLAVLLNIACMALLLRNF
jgi:uncharacterized membrane protein YsdA (DUF1294 family)